MNVEGDGASGAPVDAVLQCQLDLRDQGLGYNPSGHSTNRTVHSGGMMLKCNIHATG